jgi:hypothetical protein
VLGSLAHFRVILFFFEGSRVGDLSNKNSKFLADDVINLLVVMRLGSVPVILLIGNEVGQLRELRYLQNLEGLFFTHDVEALTNFFETIQESWSCLNEIPGQVLPGSVIHVESNITLPEREDFTHNVVFKEFHAGEDIEHGGLLHPLAQREKFGWDNLTLGTSSTFFLDDMDHTLG